MNAIETLIANALWTGTGYRSPYEDLPVTADLSRLADLYEQAGTHRGDCKDKASADRAAIELHVRLLAQVRFDDEEVGRALQRIDAVKLVDRRERRKTNDRKRRELRKIKRDAVYGGVS